MGPLHPNLPPILAVDDSADDLFFLERLLRKSGTTLPLLKFGDAEAAVAYLDDSVNAAEPCNIPCFVFTDLRMPQMNGIEFVAWIRSHKKLNRLPIVMLSTSCLPEDVRRSEEAGVDRYFVKFPIPEEVAVVLRKIVKPPSDEAT